ncbi:MAG: YlxR family protein [Dehalococcoidia bacterium]|nr:YlxR family protein [Dehalococcoidia bacterium]
MPATKRAPRPRHVPLRTCVACRTTEAKRGLVRVVRTPDGRVLVDATGKHNGRGAYVHESRACWELALKRARLGQALKVTLPAADLEALKAHAAALPADQTETQTGRTRETDNTP